MKIKHAKISNWRSIKEIDFKVSDLMVVIGQNNHGKSNLLSSFLFFFGEIKHQDLDFYCRAGCRVDELFVEITFSDLDDNDKTTFQKYLTSDDSGENVVVVRKTAYRGGSFDYKGYIENPSDEWLRESKASDYTSRDIAKKLPFYSRLPQSGRLSKQHIIDAQTAHIEEHKDSLLFTRELESNDFLGVKSAKGIFGDVYFIPAVKDATDDFVAKDSSVFGKIYSGVIADISSGNDDWKEARSRLKNIFGTLRPPQITEFETDLSNELRGVWEAKVDIEVATPDIESVFKANTKVWIDDGERTDIQHKGHGLQRALTLALVHVMAARAQKMESDEERKGRKASDSRYYIIEEPELYLHPQAQRSLFDSFKTLSEKRGSQVFLSTHSSVLIDVEKYKTIYIVTKNGEGSKVKNCPEDLLTGNKENDFKLSHWINPDRGELFFAKKVLLVEGMTDKVVIPFLAEQLGVFRHDYTLIDCGSKHSIQHYLCLLNKFKIPYVAIYDKDNPDCKKQASETKKIEDNVCSTLGRTIAFENKIEDEIGITNGKRSKPFNALKHISSSEFSMSENLKEKIRSAYA